MTQNRGRVLIEFATLEDLERIYRVMTESSKPREVTAPPTDVDREAHSAEQPAP